MAKEASKMVCVRKCIFRNRRFRVGETVVPRADEVVPRHFVAEADYRPGIVPKEPRTLKEITEEHAKARKPKTGMAAKPSAKDKGKKKKPEDPFA